MNNATETGLIAHCFTAWMTEVEDQKNNKKLQTAMYDTDCRLKSYMDKQAGNAMGVQTRTIEQMKENMVLKSFGAWKIDTKVALFEKHFSKKMEAKRGQLAKVQSLFRKFAQELEEGLGNIDGDSSSRTTGRRTRGDRQGMTM